MGVKIASQYDTEDDDDDDDEGEEKQVVTGRSTNITSERDGRHIPIQPKPEDDTIQIYTD